MEAMIRRDSEQSMALWIIQNCLRDCWLIYAIRPASLPTLFCVFLCFHINCLLIHRIALKALTTLITSNHVLSGRWREERMERKEVRKVHDHNIKSRENFFWLIIFCGSLELEYKRYESLISSIDLNLRGVDSQNKECMGRQGRVGHRSLFDFIQSSFFRTTPVP